MKSRNFVFMKTHVIQPAVIEEFIKLARSGYDTFLFVDNSKGLLKDKGGIYQQETLFGHKINCVLYDEPKLDALNIPKYTSCNSIMWYNADYPMYMMRRYFSDYDFYWQFEFDVFMNGKDYKPFFKKYINDKTDLIITNIRKAEPDWLHSQKTDWIYQGKVKYASFFPVARLSAKALDLLYRKRIEQGKVYQTLNTDENDWAYCELFVPTEVIHNHLTAKSLKEKIGSRNINLNQNRIFLHPDNKLYHPIKIDMNFGGPVSYKKVYSNFCFLKYLLLSILTFGKMKKHYKKKYREMILKSIEMSKS